MGINCHRAKSSTLGNHNSTTAASFIDRPPGCYLYPLGSLIPSLIGYNFDLSNDQADMKLGSDAVQL